MDRISTRSPKAPAPSWSSLEIDGETGRLGPDRVFVQRTPVGYVCAGLGDPARLLRFAFEHPQPTDRLGKSEDYETNPIFAAACERLDKAVAAGGIAKARRLGLQIPFGSIEDPALRRLAIAAALVKSGFDPNQPRDEDGRWTDGGGDEAGSDSGGGDRGSGTESANASTSLRVDVSTPSTAVTDAAAVSGTITALGETEAIGAGWGLWGEWALSLLPRIAGLAGPIALVGELVFAPANRSGELESSGTLPDHPDISYFRSEGRLQLFQRGADGQLSLLYDGIPGDDDFYRDADGHVIGRSLGLTKGFVLDPAAISTLSPPTMDARAKEKDPAEEAARNAALAGARAIVRAVDQARVCPDPTFDWPHGASEAAELYEEQITRVPRGIAFDIDGTKFDGCRYWGDGTMLEAKGAGYAWAMTPNGWRPTFRDGSDMEVRMAAQSAKAWAVGKRVEWHVAEAPVANYLKVYAQRFPNVDVIWDPPLRNPANRKVYMWESIDELSASGSDFMRFDLFKHLSAVRASSPSARSERGEARYLEAKGQAQ